MFVSYSTLLAKLAPDRSGSESVSGSPSKSEAKIHSDIDSDTDSDTDPDNVDQASGSAEGYLLT